MIKEKRKQLGFTQEQIANKLNISLRQYVRIDSEEDLPRRDVLKNLITELELTNEEIPHAVTCITTKYQEKTSIVNINVDIIVSRANLKKIIIGRGGKMLKEIGSRARVDLENALGKQVYLELYVKTIENWRDKERYLKEFGIIDE